MIMITTSFIADTINLADYFFIGSDFNWKNIELTSEKMGEQTPGEEDLHLLAGAHPADEDDSQFWIEYENIELVFRIGVNTDVEWCPMNEAAFENTESDTILPRLRNERLALFHR